MRGLLQLTLDLFTSQAQPSPTRPPASKPRRARPARPISPDLAAADLWSQAGATAQPLPAQEPVAEAVPGALQAEPALSLAQALEPATYRHPQATRELMLAGVHVAYAFRRGRRRTIGFSVDAQGLAVSAPRWVPLREVDRAVLEKSDWILRKLQETRQHHRQLEAARIEWRNGAQLSYLGQTLTLELDPSQRKGQALEGDAGEQRLRLGLPHTAGADQIRDAAQAWLMRRAREFFEQRLNHYAPQLGVQWSRLSLSSAATRWGSASADGRDPAALAPDAPQARPH